MKLTIVFLITSFLSVHATGISQTVTFTGKNVPLEKVFTAIKEQTSYVVFGSLSLLKNTRPVSVTANKIPLSDFLKEVLKDQSLTYTIEGRSIILSSVPVTPSPDKLPAEVNPSLKDPLVLFVPITGIVRNAAGQPLSGINVVVKGSTRGTVTDAEGKFTVNVSNGDLLVFTGIGFERSEVKVAAQREYSITLQARSVVMDTASVEVSTGYQKIPKERATGSYSTITSAEIGKKVAPNLMERLEGSVSGLLVNVGTPDRSLVQNRDNFTIRGISTINSEKKPLIVLDGFPTELDLVNINPDNIQSITILKDAAAASIWGVRAANGVIVIESKKGSYSNRPVVNFSSIFTVTGRPRLDYVPRLNSAQYLDVERELVDKNVLPPLPSPFTIYQPPLSPGVDLYLQLKKGIITQQKYDTEVQRMSAIDVNDQMQEYLLRSPISQQYNISISGGSSIARNFLSASFNNEYPNNKGDYGNRLVINFSNETRISSRLTFSAETFMTLLQQKNNSIGLGVSKTGAAALRPYDQIVDANGAPVNFSYYTKSNTLDSLAANGFLPWKYNYINELANADNTSRSLVYRLTAGLDYRIAHWMSAEVKYMTEREFDKTRNYYSPETYLARNTINRYTTAATPHVRGVPVGGVLDLQDAEQNNYNIRGQLNFSPAIGDAGHLDAVAGVELRQTLSSGYGNRLYGYDDRLLSSGAVNYGQQYKTLTGNLTIPYNQNVNNRKDRYASVFGNFTYTYRSRYSLSGSFRKDDSNLFGASKEFRTVPLWSLGGMWRAKEEDFLKNVNWLSKLNIRATAGYNGNLNKGTSPYLVMQSNGLNAINRDPYGSIFNPANPQLRWERVQTFNAGTDLSAFNYRISGSIDVYWRKSLDLLGNVDINPTYGFTSLLANRLQMTSRGIDLELNAKVIRTSAFSWTPSINFSFNTNKVTEAYFQQQTTSYYTSGKPIQGQQLGSLYTYRFAGLNETGAPMIYNGKGQKISANLNSFDETDLGALQFQGNTTPPYFGGLSNTLTWQHFELFALFTFKAGHKFMRPTALFYQGYFHKDLADRWRKPGDELKTNVPAIQPNGSIGAERYVNSDLFLENAGYIRFRDVTLTYNIPAKNIGWNVFQALNVSVTGRNLALWTANKAGIDPDYLNNIALSALPPSRSIVFSVKATF